MTIAELARTHLFDDLEPKLESEPSASPVSFPPMPTISLLHIPAPPPASPPSQADIPQPQPEFSDTNIPSVSPPQLVPSTHSTESWEGFIEISLRTQLTSRMTIVKTPSLRSPCLPNKNFSRSSKHARYPGPDSSAPRLSSS